MKIAMFGTLITIVSNQADMIIVAKFKIRVFTIVAVSMRVFQVAISIILFKYLGLIGMGIAEVMRAFVHLIIFTLLDYKMYGIKFNHVFLRVAVIVLLITLSAVFVSELDDLCLRYSFGLIIFLASVSLLIFSSKKYMGIDFMTLLKSKLQIK
jgi:PST family polysaccharide transporter